MWTRSSTHLGTASRASVGCVMPAPTAMLSIFMTTAAATTLARRPRRRRAMPHCVLYSILYTYARLRPPSPRALGTSPPLRSLKSKRRNRKWHTLHGKKTLKAPMGPKEMVSLWQRCNGLCGICPLCQQKSSIIRLAPKTVNAQNWFGLARVSGVTLSCDILYRTQSGPN